MKLQAHHEMRQQTWTFLWWCRTRTTKYNLLFNESM